jgi:two-component system OmpR family response regulator
LRVLIIDDTPEIAELLTFALRDQGHEVAAMGYTADIVGVVGEAQPEAVVLDCSTYEMSQGLFDSLREDDRYERLPVVIVTDTPDRAVTLLQKRDARRVLLVPKPFTAQQVAYALRQLLQPPAPDAAGS